MIAIPETRPKISREEAQKICEYFQHPFYNYQLTQITIRGYYLNTIGETGKNDRGVYDDACILMGPGGLFRTYNGNADPNSYRKGYGIGDKKGIARLKEGLYHMWKLDLHKGKVLALCQRLGECTVIRDGNPEYEQTSRWLGINSHEGGYNTTGSLGCITVPPQQYDEYITTARVEMELAHGPITEYKKGKTVYRDLLIPNIMIEETTRRTKIAI